MEIGVLVGLRDAAKADDEEFGERAGAERGLRAGFKFRGTETAPFPVVSGLPLRVGVGCRRIAARCGVGGRGDWWREWLGVRPLRRVLLRGINGPAAGGCDD